MNFSANNILPFIIGAVADDFAEKREEINIINFLIEQANGGSLTQKIFNYIQKCDEMIEFYRVFEELHKILQNPRFAQLVSRRLWRKNIKIF